MNRKRLTKKIKKKWSEFTRIYGHELGFASVTIRYTDDGNSFDTYISMTVDSNDTKTASFSILYLVSMTFWVC